MHVIQRLTIRVYRNFRKSSASAVGVTLAKVASALTQGTLWKHLDPSGSFIVNVIAIDNTALNVVRNQEYAQAVPHK